MRRQAVKKATAARRCAHGNGRAIAEFLHQLLELKLAEQLVRELAVGFRPLERFQVQIDRHFAVDGRQFERLADYLLIVLQAFAIGLVRDLVGTPHRFFGGAVFEDEF